MPETIPLNAVDSFVGMRVQSRRRELQLSVNEFTDTLGISIKELIYYEAGTMRIGYEMLLRMATALDVAEPYFYEGLTNRKSD